MDTLVTKVFAGAKAVGIAAVLAQKDKRALIQTNLLTPTSPVLSLKLNIAGPLKNSALINRFFVVNALRLRHVLQRANYQIKQAKLLDTSAGCEVIWQLQIKNRLLDKSQAQKLKQLCALFEQSEPALRLFDVDVLWQSNDKTIHTVKRSAVNLPARQCLICDDDAKECGRSRRHEVHQLQRKTAELIVNNLTHTLPKWLADCAQSALLLEVSTPKKPGLVDPLANAEHPDMDVLTFIFSSVTLANYFKRAAKLAVLAALDDNCSLPDLFLQLRQAGIQAEAQMNLATGNVNTHKGAIFSSGLLVAALGYVFVHQDASTTLLLDDFAVIYQAIQTTVKQMTSQLLKLDAKKLANSQTAGSIQYQKYGLLGARAAAMAGYRDVFEVGLKTLQQASGTRTMKVLTTFVALCKVTIDSNLIKRADTPDIITWWHTQLAALTDAGGLNTAAGRKIWDALLAKFAKEKYSLGGSADLLIATLLCDLVLGGILDDLETR